MEFVTKLFDTSDFPARWYCGRWSSGHGWLHILSDLGVFSAYFAIPVVLAYFLLQRKDLPFRGLLILFAAFILLCGTTHLMDAALFWWPAYRLSSILKLSTAIVSWITVFALIQVVPKVLLLRSPAELEREIAARIEAEQALKKGNSDLERRIEERTAELVKANVIVNQERERFRITLGSIGDAVIAIDTDGRVTFLNDVAHQLTGWTAESALGKPLTEVMKIINQETRHTVENPAVRALSEGNNVYLANHVLLIAKDGSELSIEDSAAPIKDQFGGIIGVVLVFRDVTGRKRYEDQLRESEQRFRLMADSIPQMAWKARPNGDIYWFNRRWYDYSGTTLEQMAGWGWQSLHDPEILSKVLERWKASIATGEPFEMVYPLRGQDGLFRTFLSRVMPVKDNDGQVMLWVGTNTDVTEAKNAEDRIRESSERLDFALSASDLGQWDLNLSDHTANRTLRHDQIFGYDQLQANWTYDIFINHVSAEDRQWVDDQFKASIATGEPLNVECRILRADGRERWIWTKARTQRDARGGLVRMLGVVGDITDSKQQEVRLRQSEGRLAAIIEAIPQLVWTADANGQIDFANRRWYDYTAMTPEQTMGSGWISSIHPDDLQKTAARWKQSWESREPIEIEYRLRGASAEYRWQLVRGVPLIDSSGRVTNWFGTITDIHDRKQADEDRQKFVSLVENSTDFIGLFEIEGSPIYINQAGMRLIGLDSWDDARLVPFRDYFFPDDQDRMMNEFLPSIVEKKHGEIEIRFRHFKTGEARWMIQNIFTVSTAQGEVTGVGTVSRDITERRRLEDELRQIASDLSEADHRKDEFLATLAHELRNPLAPIRNGLQVLRLAGHDPAAVAEVRTMMERQLGQMVRLVDDLLEVSRITQNKLELRLTVVELRKVVTTAVETSQQIINESGHELTVTLPPTPIYLKADEIRLAQILSNLLNNAAKYTKLNGHIQLTAKLEGKNVFIGVKDDGIGIKAEMLSKVFDLFAQADQALERSQGGLGIGLTLVKRLVEMHGGTVTAHSDGQGQGSEFVVQLPVYDEGGTGTALQAEVANPTIQKRRILIVDDNRDSATSLSMMLSLMGNDIRTAHDGMEAVEAATKFIPDVILLDIGLPKLNGYEVCRRIREQSWSKGVIIIACTGWGQEDDIRKANDAGFDHHMVKPVDPAALGKILAKLNRPKNTDGSRNE